MQPTSEKFRVLQFDISPTPQSRYTKLSLKFRINAYRNAKTSRQVGRSYGQQDREDKISVACSS